MIKNYTYLQQQLRIYCYFFVIC